MTPFEQVISTTMDQAGMTNPQERAMFLAQLAHESASGRLMVEGWNPKQVPEQVTYEPPSRKAATLGNTQKGDGFRFRGRGYIQLTGRGNYRRCGQYLGIDLENNPDLAMRPDIAAKTALWYWRVERPGIPALAQAGNLREVTRQINGGYNHLDRRQALYDYYLPRELQRASAQPAKPVIPPAPAPTKPATPSEPVSSWRVRE